MANTVSIPEADYAVGTIQRTLDSFPASVSEIALNITRVAWPGVPADNVIKVSVSWSTGAGAAWELPGGVVLDRQGNPVASHTLIIGVPYENDGAGGRRKRNTVAGTITIDVRQPLRTAISAQVR